MKSKTKMFFIVFACMVFSLAFSAFAFSYLVFLARYPGKDIKFEWQASDTFEISKIKTVEKQPDKDFVILNLADVQMCDLENFFNFNVIKSEIDFLIQETKPDLITLTGDQTWSNENLLSLTNLIKWLESYKIPYAPVFGNHDFGNKKDNAVLSQKACCDIYENAPHCLFSRGPTNIGSLGNYVFNITENGQIIKTIYMIDSGIEEEISDTQIEWIKWNAEGIKTANGGVSPESMCFLHKPLPQYRTAFQKYVLGSDEVEAIGDVYVTYSLSGTTNAQVFETLKEFNVLDIVCGHQHGNNFTLKYQGVRLTFALKTDELVGFAETEDFYLNGATTFTISNTNTTIENHFVPRNKFKI